MAKDETESPNEVSVDTTRMSVAPKIIVVAILSAFALVVVYSLASKNQPQEEEVKEQPKQEITGTNNDEFINSFTAKADYSEPVHFEIPTRKDEEFVPESDKPREMTPEEQKEMLKNRPDELELKADLPPNTAQPDPRFEEYKQLRKQQFMQALTSQPRNSNFNGSNSSTVIHGSDRSSLQRPSSDASYQEKMNYYNQRKAEIQRLKNSGSDYSEKLALAKQLMAETVGNGNTNASNSSSSAISADNNNNSNEPRNWQLNSTLEAPKALTVNTGFVIPATLITGVNSDLPGHLIGQVSQNVYDTATGQYLLIPQGTKLFGIYNSGIMFGQERVMVAWNRLVFPDGRTLDLGQMAGSDMGGYSGFTDQVNNHYWKLFKSAFLLSMVTASVTYTDNKYVNDKDTKSASSAMAEALGNELGSVTTELIRKHMNVSPTIEIRSGYRFNVIVNKDISFTAPYKN
ncbi:TrbI/VirB10 family protein [uncultured Succinivibrio sp.]|uniref:TrbI/VirB10 family protein n=1 Tax=uncultured Succinivibrio sp. TaxID=540749 RepID=UPI0025FA6586|nr:TrbI/VirB10 family protein [uncultured Succinivibrio sp.]